MNKILFFIGVIFIIISCSKNDIQNTNDLLNKANDALKTAENSFKTLDSISNIVQDTAKFNKIISPEIQKHKESIEKILKSNSFKSDSIQKKINDIKKKIGIQKEIQSTIDSISSSLKINKNPIEAIKKISKQLENINPDSLVKNLPPQINNNNTSPSQNSFNFSEPIKKYGNLNFDVSDINSAKTQISNYLNTYQGYIISEQFSENEKIKKLKLKLKFPLKNYDIAVENISNLAVSNLSKTIQSSGSEYNSEELCTLEITISENPSFYNPNSFGTQELSQTTTSDKPEGIWDTMKKYGTIIIGSIILFLILILVLFIWILNKLSKKEKKKVTQQATSEDIQNTSEQQNNFLQTPQDTNHSIESETDPYEKYKPKPKL